ncbi:MAG: zinc ribbon domain-containing protein [Chloroflexi bacterium]|nr:zinc ribbon domain-containing protein [Chloroflexota bacterium]
MKETPSMPEFSRMPRYDVRNDGIGPYAVFYCDTCDREFRSQPEVINTVAKDIGRQAVGGFLRNIPLVGGAVANSVTGEDPRYTYHLTPQQVEKAWDQVKIHFRECPTCLRIVCLSDFDEQSGYCNEDSPRKDEIAEAEGEQAGRMIKGIASAFGLGDVIKKASEAAKVASGEAARCPNDGTLAPAGTKFCPECGTPMVQPAKDVCPSCGAPANGAKFCPECGTKIMRAPENCPSCGAPAKGVKFCPECGTKIV